MRLFTIGIPYRTATSSQTFTRLRATAAILEVILSMNLAGSSLANRKGLCPA